MIGVCGHLLRRRDVPVLAGKSRIPKGEAAGISAAFFLVSPWALDERASLPDRWPDCADHVDCNGDMTSAPPTPTPAPAPTPAPTPPASPTGTLAGTWTGTVIATIGSGAPRAPINTTFVFVHSSSSLTGIMSPSSANPSLTARLDLTATFTGNLTIVFDGKTAVFPGSMQVDTGTNTMTGTFSGTNTDGLPERNSSRCGSLRPFRIIRVTSRRRGPCRGLSPACCE